MSYRRFLTLAMLALAPATVSAQFTTFIPPQSRARDSVQAAAAAAQTAQADSAMRAGVTNLTTWVDSAAGAVTPGTVADSLAATNQPATTLVEGSTAPMTASPLPTLLVTGSISLLLGLVLVRGHGNKRRA